MVYAVKHDGRHKARLVAGGHLTETPMDSAYSSVISLRGVIIFAFLGELNGLKAWSTDIGNAYLETHTKEKLCIIAGPEFGDYEGHVLIMLKALCGLHSSGLRWSEQLASVRWGASHLRPRRTFGCVIKEITTSALQCVLMT